MGVGYNKSLVQWSRGEYTSANQAEDDVSIIAGRVGFLADDHADVQAAATALAVDSSGAMSGSGVIATRTDKDWFRFATQAGSVSFNVAPFELSDGKANLDVQVRLLNSSGTVVSTINETNRLDTVWSGTLAKGIYSIEIDGVGKAAISGDNGYSDYGSLGSFTVGGSVIKNRDPILNLDQASVQGFEGTTLINTGTWSDPDNDSVVISASIGAVMRSNDGTWEWNLAVGNDTPETVVDLTITDELGAETTASFTYLVSNRAPVLTVANAAVSGPVLGTLTNSGTWSDVPADTVTLTASLGTIIKNNDGTWNWSYVPDSSLSNQVVTITARDSNRGTSSITFNLDALVTVVNSKVFYRGSSFAGTSVNAALDTAKVLAKSGATAKTLDFSNLINTTAGINGLVFDVAGLATTNLTSSDIAFRMSPSGAFSSESNPPSSWVSAPAPSAIVVTPGTSTTPARVRIDWPNGAIMNRWLQIKLQANASTGLLVPQTYYLGHLQGEVNGAFELGGFFVRTFDVAMITAAIDPSITVPVTSVLDLDKDGRVRTMDRVAALDMIGLRLTRITVPPAGAGGEGETTGVPLGKASQQVGIVLEAVQPYQADVLSIGARCAEREYTVAMASDRVFAESPTVFTYELLSSLSGVPEHRSMDQLVDQLVDELDEQNRICKKMRLKRFFDSRTAGTRDSIPSTSTIIS
jgi:hypothetical protein